MENKRELPKVLVVGINAWREDGTAHTLMDIFRCWDPKKVALVYSRADLPNTDVCKRFFQISESEVMKSVVKPWMKVGREVESTPSNKSAGHEKLYHKVKPGETLSSIAEKRGVTVEQICTFSPAISPAASIRSSSIVMLPM